MISSLAPSAEVLAHAEALKILRVRQGFSQEQAAGRIGQRKQSWQAYEAGHRQAILRTDLQDRLMRALDLTRTDLEQEVQRIRGGAAAPDGPAAAAERIPPSMPPARPENRPAAPAVPVWGRGRGGLRGAHVYDVAEPERWLDLATLYGPSCRAMQLIGDSVYPWAASGTTIVYDLDRWPRKDQGCVIETREHGYYVKLFDRVDDEKLYVKELQPQERTIEFPLADVVGVYAVQDRIDR